MSASMKVNKLVHPIDNEAMARRDSPKMGYVVGVWNITRSIGNRGRTPARIVDGQSFSHGSARLGGGTVGRIVNQLLPFYIRGKVKTIGTDTLHLRFTCGCIGDASGCGPIVQLAIHFGTVGMPARIIATRAKYIIRIVNNGTIRIMHRFQIFT